MPVVRTTDIVEEGSETLGAVVVRELASDVVVFGQIINTFGCIVVHHSIRSHTHAKRPPTGRRDLRTTEIATATVAANSQVGVVVVTVPTLAFELDKHAGPINFVAHLFDGSLKDSDPDFFVDHRCRFECQSEPEMRPTAVFPLSHRRQEHASRHAGDFRYVDASFQSILDVRNKIILMHLAARPTWDAGESRPHQQRPFAAWQTTRRRANTLDDVGMASLDPFVPTAIRTAPHRATLVLVDVFGAFGIVGNVVPIRILKIIRDTDDFGSGARNDSPLSMRGLHRCATPQQHRDSASDTKVRDTHVSIHPLWLC
ncbi:hypothetical protein RMSM_05730 [Rhodopirellula maiorica SM1]|uniref:Uncharacterized protein n=1 Tax=Rhodopirellula maiorica SM1 TaxID=1265738 RepID=M5RPQ5_9BACT|nr:hypothetical protein RMSM_05730 [Rhodopirellula maiorica SM1]